MNVKFELVIFVSLLLVVITGFIFLYRKIITKKNRSITNQIKEYDKLQKTTERVLDKNLILYGCLQKQIKSKL